MPGEPGQPRRPAGPCPGTWFRCGRRFRGPDRSSHPLIDLFSGDHLRGCDYCGGQVLRRIGGREAGRRRQSSRARPAFLQRCGYSSRLRGYRDRGTRSGLVFWVWPSDPMRFPVHTRRGWQEDQLTALVTLPARLPGSGLHGGPFRRWEFPPDETPWPVDPSFPSWRRGASGGEPALLAAPHCCRFQAAHRKNRLKGQIAVGGPVSVPRPVVAAQSTSDGPGVRSSGCGVQEPWPAHGVSVRRTRAGNICRPTSTMPHWESTDMHRVVCIPASWTSSIRRRAILRVAPLGLRLMKAVGMFTLRGRVATGKVGVNRTR